MNLNFKPFPVISTSRLLLRQLAVSDAGDIHLLRSDPEVNKMLGRQTSAGIDDALAFITHINTMTANGDGIYWVLEVKEGGELAGTVCLYNFDADKNEAEIGYELLPAYHGRGLATEAVKAVIDYAFETMKAGVIAATPAEVNAASIKLLEKLNFKPEGSFTVGPDKVVLLDYRLKNIPI